MRAAAVGLAILSPFLLWSTDTIRGSAEPPTAILRALEGRWGCTGGFAHGPALAADLSFAQAQDGRVVRFKHVDRSPSEYWQEAIWAFDAKTNRVFSLSTSGSNTNRAVSPALFTARTWTDHEITLNADSLNGPPWAQNRFTYSVREPERMTMRWEIQRAGAWALGDSLICVRAP